MLNDSKLITDLTTYFADLDPTSTPAIKATKLQVILKEYITSGTIKVGTLSSSGTGNMGNPVNSTNTSGGKIE